MNRHTLVILFWWSMVAPVWGQTDGGYIERDYFLEAEAQNASLAAARYAEEAYYYLRQANSRTDLSAFRADVDTVLFYLRKTEELANSALLKMTPADTIEAYLYRGIELSTGADRALRHIYPFLDLNSMQLQVDRLLPKLMHAKIDLYTASLYLSDGKLERAEEEFSYEQLNLEHHVARLDADEAAFADLILTLEDQLRALNSEIEQLREQLANTTGPEERKRLEEALAAKIAERDQLLNSLANAKNRQEQIREDQKELLQKSGVLSETADDEDGSGDFKTDQHGYYNDKEVGVNEPLPDGLVYRIQLGYFFKADGKDAFHGLFPISGEDLGDGKIRYYAGMFTSYLDATRAKNYIREKRIGDAFVVPYLDGKKVNVKRAIEIEKEIEHARD